MTNPAPTESIDRDINDIFDDILLTEEKLTEQGYTTGFADGVKSGNAEGYHLGYHRGAELAAELGYYYGFTEFYLKSINTEQINKILNGIRQSIDLFPQTNDENIDIFNLIDKIRAQFRRVCALMKVNFRYPEADSLNF